MMDVLMASPTEPLAEKKRNYQLTRMLTAMHNLEQAPEPTIQDWEHVNDAVMLMEALRDMGVVQDPDNLLDDAIEALGKAGARAMEGKGIRLDGMAIKDLRAVLEDYAEVMAQLPARTMIAAHRKAETKVAKIVRKR
jgi:hypothetical protein